MNHTATPIGINLEQVDVEYPLFDAGAQDLQRRIVNLVTFKKVKPSFTPVKVVNALKNISFRLDPGSAVGLIGRNGSGKSTLLKVMAGVMEPSRGSIWRCGKINAILTIGSGMESELNGYQNIQRLGLLWGLSVEEIRGLVPDIIEFSQLGDFIYLPVRTYSSGMRMRLAFAIATVGTPDILLIDEVFGVGDSQFRERAKQRISKLLQRSRIVVISSHADDLIREFCTRCLYLENGRIKAYGDTDEVIKLYHADQKQQQNHTPAENLSLRIA